MKFVFIMSLAALLTVAACSDDASRKETIKTYGTGMIHDKNTLRVVLYWPGDDFASKQDIDTRNKIQRLISENNVGNVVRIGTGMGWMDLIVEVQDKKTAQSSISEIMHIVAPTRKFTIE